jgi:hypothetical protein
MYDKLSFMVTGKNMFFNEEQMLWLGDVDGMEELAHLSLGN